MASATISLTVPAIGKFSTCAAHLRRHPTVVLLGRYALVGGLGTGLNVALFLIARLWLSAVPANVVAIVLCTLLTTEANRRFTFHVRRGDRWRTVMQNVGTMVFYAFYGSAVLLLLSAVVDRPTALMGVGRRHRGERARRAGPLQPDAALGVRTRGARAAGAHHG